jgi:hypothetical protein
MASFVFTVDKKNGFMGLPQQCGASGRLPLPRSTGKIAPLERVGFSKRSRLMSSFSDLTSAFQR